MPTDPTARSAAARKAAFMISLAMPLFLGSCGAPPDPPEVSSAPAVATPACPPAEMVPTACQAESVGERLRLVFYTDVQATTEWGVPDAMIRAADAINAAEPDLVIAGGDLIFDGFSSTQAEAQARWDVYSRLRDRIDAPIHAAIGNHDLVDVAGSDPQSGEDPRSSFLKNVRLERSYYSFDAHGYHFIVLDTVQIVGGQLGYEGGIDPVQREWLISDLAAVDAETPLVVVSHMPLLTAYPAATGGWLEVPSASRVILGANELLALFDGHDLELVLQGHLHVFEKIEWRGTTFVTGGAISGNWWKGDRLGTAEGFCVIDFGEEGPEVRYRNYDWQSLPD